MVEPEPESVQDIKFSFFFSLFSLSSSGLLVLVCVLSEGIAAFGTVLHSCQFLALGAAYEVGKVGLAKMLSGHGSSLRLSLPPVGGHSDNKPIRGPFLRKFWIKLCRLVSVLTPLWQIARGGAILVSCWLFLLYITICFGAPLRTELVETGSFCLLLTLLTVYPVVLVLGPSTSAVSRVWVASSDSAHLESCLHTVGLATLLGAWLGAVPIPLDWDRDWQVWPISCCLGAVSGHVTGNLVTVARLWPRMASVQASRDRRKFM